MIQKFIIQENHPRLLIFFAGWGADETPFKDYRPANSDYMICYDYRNLSFDSQVLKSYKKVNIVGWSMGVWAASQVLGQMIEYHNKTLLDNSLPKFGSAIAINGTPFPIDEERGIPPAIYHATLEGLTGASLHKFLRRMCENSAEFKKFLAVTPHRPLEELREELIAIERMYTTQPAYSFKWNLAVISTEDRIIPPANQEKAWEHNEISKPFMTKVHGQLNVEGAHYDRELFETYLEEIWTNN